MTKTTKKELNALIEKGEGYRLEFKESFSSSISKEMCAFANSTGGRILLGVGDEGRITGLKITNRLISQIHDLARNLDPSLQIDSKKCGNVLVIDVPEGKEKPYGSNDGIYMRQGPNSQKLRISEMRDFFSDEGLHHFDKSPNKEFDFKRDFDKKAFKSFLEKAGISKVLKTNEVLRNLGLMKGNRIRNAGAILFCRNLFRLLHSSVTCILYAGKEKIKILDKKTFDADLNSNLENAMLYLKKHLDAEYIIKSLRREEKLELPEDALREAILNAISHRDYSERRDVVIEICPDRVEIANPGGLSKKMPISEFGKKSFPRNALLFDLLMRMGLVEKAGTGIRKMRRSMREYGLKIRFDAGKAGFSAVFQRETVREKIRKNSKENDKEIDKEILQIISHNPKITMNEIGEFAGFTTSKVGHIINRLKKEGTLKREGSTKKGWWKIKEKVKENDKEILLIIRSNPEATMGQIETLTGLTKRKVEKTINRLKKEGTLKREGSTKKGIWRIRK